MALVLALAIGRLVLLRGALMVRTACTLIKLLSLCLSLQATMGIGRNLSRISGIINAKKQDKRE